MCIRDRPRGLLEQARVVVDGKAPFAVVVVAVGGARLAPGAAAHAGVVAEEAVSPAHAATGEAPEWPVPAALFRALAPPVRCSNRENNCALPASRPCRYILARPVPWSIGPNRPVMSVIAVVNRKGGSGKSTLATHLAAHFANSGVPVMLGDVDRQQSTQSWLRERSLRELPRSAPIVGWAVDPKRVLRPPAGVRHVVLDTPGGLRGFDLARVVAFADVILMPVCNSIFDRESAADCFAEMMALPRVASGRCRVATIGFH